MANHKSAEKRNRQSQVRRLRNRANTTRMRNVMKAVDAAIEGGSQEDAQAALQAAVPVIAKTASKGTIHKKNASRKVSRLAKRVNRMQATA